MTLEKALLEGKASLRVLQLVLGFLDVKEAGALLEASPRCRSRVWRARRRFQVGSARLALAIWCSRHLRLEFQSFYQEKETQTVPRSSDPRVPPLVRSYWAERGKVTGGNVVLKPSELPIVSEDGITLQFSGGESAGQRPMLTHVEQNGRRIYTSVSLKIVKSTSDPTLPSSTDNSSSGDVVLRTFTYVKEFGEWQTLSPVEKHAFDQLGAHCRYDLVSLDGSVVFELDVPSGAEAQVDYYLVKKCVVLVHMQEVLQRFFSSIRPIESLPGPSGRRPCLIRMAFRQLDGRMIDQHSLSGEISIEQDEAASRPRQATSTEGEVGSQDVLIGDQVASAATAPPSRPRTGVEKLAIISCQVPKRAASATTMVLPKQPGYCCLEIRDMESGHLFFYSAALHRGAQTEGMLFSLNFRWLPGVLEYYPAMDSRHRRCLQGQVHISTYRGSGEVKELAVVAQFLGRDRLQQYAASIKSYTRDESVVQRHNHVTE